MCSWKRRDARLVPYIARSICHMYPASSSPRGGYIAIGLPCGTCQRNADVVQGEHTVCRPLSFSIDAATEMIILMHLRGAVPANVSNRIPWATSIATSLLRTNGPLCSLFHLVEPLTSDLLASSRRDRHTFEQVMSDHCLAVGPSTDLNQMWSQPFTRLVVINWSLVDLMCGNETHRNHANKG